MTENKPFPTQMDIIRNPDGKEVSITLVPRAFDRGNRNKKGVKYLGADITPETVDVFSAWVGKVILAKLLDQVFRTKCQQVLADNSDPIDWDGNVISKANGNEEAEVSGYININWEGIEEDLKNYSAAGDKISTMEERKDLLVVEANAFAKSIDMSSEEKMKAGLAEVVAKFEKITELSVKIEERKNAYKERLASKK